MNAKMKSNPARCWSLALPSATDMYVLLPLSFGDPTRAELGLRSSYIRRRRGWKTTRIARYGTLVRKL